MEDLLSRVWENLIDRTEGPMSLRFFIQPTMSLIFAIRAGLKDVRNGTMPYLWRAFVSKGMRKHIAKEGWKDFGKIFVIGIALDVIYQLIVVFKLKSEERFYPLESVIVAIGLAIVPYLLFRGPVSRISSLLKRPKPMG
jgi:hypothetical protein